MSCLAPLYWTGTPIPQQLSVLAAGISLSPSQRIVFRQSFFLEGTQLFQGLCFGLRGGNHVLRVVEQQGWLFLWGLWLSASRILCVKGLGGTWKVKKSDHSLLVPFAFVRGKKKIIPCLCQWLQALFSRGFSWRCHLVDDFSRQKRDIWLGIQYSD